IAQDIVNTFKDNPTELSNIVSMDVPQEQLAELRPDHPIRVQFPRRELFFPSEENVRLASIEVDQARFGVSFPGQRSTFKLIVAHSKVSHLAYAGIDYLFRHYNDATKSPLRWGVRYQNDGSLSPEQPSDATKSLLYALLSKYNLQGHILLFARPAAD